MNKLARLLRIPVIRKIVVTLIIAGLATAGVAIDPQLADDLVTAGAAVADVL